MLIQSFPAQRSPRCGPVHFNVLQQLELLAKTIQHRLKSGGDVCFPHFLFLPQDSEVRIVFEPTRYDSHFQYVYKLDSYHQKILNPDSPRYFQENERFESFDSSQNYVFFIIHLQKTIDELFLEKPHPKDFSVRATNAATMTKNLFGSNVDVTSQDFLEPQYLEWHWTFDQCRFFKNGLFSDSNSVVRGQFVASFQKDMKTIESVFVKIAEPQ